MRMPVKSETDAYRLTFGATSLIAISLLVGSLVGPVYGLVLFGGGIFGAIAYGLAMPDPDRFSGLRDAARGSARRGTAARRRVLVIANETLVGEELRDEILRLGHPRPQLRVVAPVLPSRAHYVASDIDGELDEARERLVATVTWAAEQGFTVTGDVNDAGPVPAIEDELRRFDPDAVIISTHPPERSHWLESGVVERAREELDIPVTHVVVDLARQRVEVAR